MNTCGTCAHWLRPDKRERWGNAVSFRDDEWDEDAGDGFGEYAKGSAADRLYGECRGVPFGYDLQGPPPLAAVRDGSDFKADLYTQAEFGCALWAALDGSNDDRGAEG